MNEMEAIKKMKKICLNESDEVVLMNAIKLCGEVSSNKQIEKMGHLLRRIDQTSVDRLGLKKIRVAIISNFNADPLAHYMRGLLLKNKLWGEFYVAGFNQFEFELLNTESELYRFKPHLTMCLLDETFITSGLVKGEYHTHDVIQKLKTESRHLKKLVKQFKSHGTGYFAINTIPLPKVFHDSIIDYKTKALLSKEWLMFNAKVAHLSTHIEQAVTIDTDVMMQDVSLYRDSRLYYAGGYGMSDELLATFGKEGVKIARSLMGLNKKVAVLDLDETLWGGILGDDGLEGIQLNQTYPGNTYVDFQHYLKRLKQQGVLLAISSKNEETNVLDVLDNHPVMILKKEDFVGIKANWQPKHENIKNLEEELNIGMNQFVFVDDNPFEQQMVKAHTNVEVLDLPPDPSLYAGALLEEGWFNTVKLTEEDYSRTTKYIQSKKREAFKEESNSIEDYLAGLNIKVTIIEHPSEFDIPRIAQLSTRTNQFNLTTVRYNEVEVKKMVADPAYRVLGFSVADRFGDNGIVGAAFIKIDQSLDHNWKIENIVMSCRVFSRGIETAIIKTILTKANEEGAHEVLGSFIPTAKNKVVESLFSDHYFHLLLQDGNRMVYKHRYDNIKDIGYWLTIVSNKEVIKQ
ncbi:HAD-IIIC family phosphatase [Shouchella patagoniensis]|uniref:HAD-IIIC family phosphatase n=1 Tax=Shouchella patagoniensis TaxID=228576 RepID=UPI000995930E|nr:HAD-IIIC family phosphatase [Shouchella patagoniensis]